MVDSSPESSTMAIKKHLRCSNLNRLCSEALLVMNSSLHNPARSWHGFFYQTVFNEFLGRSMQALGISYFLSQFNSNRFALLLAGALLASSLSYLCGFPLGFPTVVLLFTSTLLYLPPLRNMKAVIPFFLSRLVCLCLLWQQYQN